MSNNMDFKTEAEKILKERYGLDGAIVPTNKTEREQYEQDTVIALTELHQRLVEEALSQEALTQADFKYKKLGGREET